MIGPVGQGRVLDAQRTLVRAQAATILQQKAFQDVVGAPQDDAVDETEQLGLGIGRRGPEKHVSCRRLGVNTSPRHCSCVELHLFIDIT